MRRHRHLASEDDDLNEENPPTSPAAAVRDKEPQKNRVLTNVVHVGSLTHRSGAARKSWFGWILSIAGPLGAGKVN
jgi:hypothetical protein